MSANTENSNKHAMDWYFDFISPYSYLQFAELRKLSDKFEINYIPVLFAGLLKYHGQLGPAEIAAKKRFMFRHITWLANRLNIPFNMPRAHPFNPLPALRLCICLGATAEAVGEIFDSIWVKRQLLDDADDFAAIAERLEVSDPDALVADTEVKTKLRQNTEQAIERGVFGVPTTIFRDELFWGFDSLNFLLEFAERPDLLKRPEMTVIDSTPSGAERKR